MENIFSNIKWKIIPIEKLGQFKSQIDNLNLILMLGIEIKNTCDKGENYADDISVTDEQRKNLLRN